MTIEDKLKEYILSKYKSIRAFTQEADIPYSTVDTMFKRGIMGMSVQNVIKMCRVLSLDVDKLAEGIIEQAKKNMALDINEFNMINQYIVLDNSGKNLVQKVTAHEFERCTKSNTEKLNKEEQDLIDKYRSSDDQTKKIINMLPDMSEEIEVYRAAMSDDDHEDEIVKMSRAEIEKLLSLPDTDEDL